MASCRDKNDERANARPHPPNGRRDRTKRSTVLGKREHPYRILHRNAAYERCVIARTQCPLKILAILLQPGYRSILLVDAHVWLCASTSPVYRPRSGMRATASGIYPMEPNDIGSMHFIAPEGLQ